MPLIAELLTESEPIIIDDPCKKLLVRYHADIPEIERTAIGDWIDLRAAESVFLPEGESGMISLGVSMRLPDGYEAHVLPRSSTYKHWGIVMVNSMGLIDNSYSGDGDIWHFPAYCLSGRVMRNGRIGSLIEKGDRICQFRLVKCQPEFEICRVDRLDGENRGGFGSTGHR